MVNLLITVTFFLMCHHEVFTDVRFEGFKRVIFEETTANSWSVNNVSSRLKCTSMCLADIGCSALAFQAPATCRGFEPQLLDVLPKIKKAEHGFPIYLKGRTVGFDQACTWDFECRVVNSVCFKGKCKCDPGFSYSNSTNVCVRECQKYGPTFSLYEGIGIIEHNDKTLLFATAYKVENCMHKCATENSFVCRSFDFKFHWGCYLSSSGYLDVDREYRLTNDEGFLFGTRNCAD